MARGQSARIYLILIAAAVSAITASVVWLRPDGLDKSRAVGSAEVGTHSASSREVLVTKTPFFSVSDLHRAFLLAASKKIRLGDTQQRVVDLLGKPTDEAWLPEKGGPRQNTKRVWTYYLTKWEKDFVNEKHDEYIKIYFAGPHQEAVSIALKVAGEESE